MASQITVPPVKLVERRAELLEQMAFESKFSTRQGKRQLLNETGISARTWQGLCKLHKVSAVGSVPRMQERLRLKGHEYFCDATGEASETAAKKS